MWYVKTPPATEPVSLSEAKAHLRVDGTDEDALITALITAARQKVEDWLGRALITQTLVYMRDEWPEGDEMALPGGQLLSLVSVKYKDSAGAEYTFGDVVADTQSIPGRIVLDYGCLWPTSVTLHPVNPICVEYTAGYGATAASVPAKIKQAILLLVGELYRNREETTAEKLMQLPIGISALLERDVVYWTESK